MNTLLHILSNRCKFTIKIDREIKHFTSLYTISVKPQIKIIVLLYLNTYWLIDIINNLIYQDKI